MRAALPGAIAAGTVVLLAVLFSLSVFELELAVNGFFLGTIIALGAMGLTLIYGILGFAHIAHGDFMTFGAYVAFFLLSYLLPRLGMDAAGLGPFTFGYPLLLAIPLTVAVLALFAISLDLAIYRRLRSRGSHLVVLAIASLGVAVAMRGMVQILWGTDSERYPRISRDFYQLPAGVRIPPDNIFIGVVAFALIVGVYLFLTRTKMGKAMRATSDNMELARVSGINTENVIRWTWFLGAALAATAGILLAVFQAQLLPIMGWKFLIPMFAAVILGGIGNPYGAFLGAMTIGVSSEVSTEWINPSYKPAIAFMIMILVLLLRPRGILGVKT